MTKTMIALLLVAAIGGCAKPAPQPQQPQKHEIPKPVALVAGGWTNLFASPADAISALNRLGFGMGEYKAAGDLFQSIGSSAFASRSTAAKPNRSNVELTGTATQLNAVRFMLDLTDPVDAKFARAQFAEQLAIRFPQIGVDGAKQVAPAIIADKAAQGSVSGADYAVTRTPLAGGAADDHRLTVIFMPSGTTPATAAKE